MPLTCEKIRGIISKTNASIDRIFAGGVYNRRNIQLVCRAVNSFRGDMTVNEFINWSKKVTYHAIRQQRKTSQERVSATKSQEANMRNAWNANELVELWTKKVETLMGMV